MNIKWMQDFLTLSEVLSPSRAAEMRHVTLPAFGRRIRSLEDWIGVPLIDRSGSRLKLTVAGEAFRDVARTAVNMIVRARNDLKQYANETTPNLTFASEIALANSVLPEWIAKLKASLGPMLLHLKSTDVGQDNNVLLDASVDFNLCFAHPQIDTPSSTSSPLYLVVGNDKLIAVTAPGVKGQPRHAVVHGGCTPHISYSSEYVLGRILRSAYQHPERLNALVTVVCSDSAWSSYAMVLKGLGVAWLPESLVRNDLESGRLMRSDHPDLDIPIEIRLYRSASNKRKLVEDVWNFLINKNQEMPTTECVA
jgi:LysR family transcriptional regulator, hypochlorite-specific transcription factor HypT